MPEHPLVEKAVEAMSELHRHDPSNTLVLRAIELAIPDHATTLATKLPIDTKAAVTPKKKAAATTPAKKPVAGKPVATTPAKKPVTRKSVVATPAKKPPTSTSVTTTPAKAQALPSSDATLTPKWRSAVKAFNQLGSPQKADERFQNYKGIELQTQNKSPRVATPVKKSELTKNKVPEGLNLPLDRWAVFMDKGPEALTKTEREVTKEWSNAFTKANEEDKVNTDGEPKAKKPRLG